MRRFFAIIRKASWTLFCLASLALILAFVTALPLFQVITLGYLLAVAGHLASGGKLKDALPNLEAAGVIGFGFLTLALASAPTRLLAHWESVAAVIDPGSPDAMRLRYGAIALSAFLTIYLGWAWARGGRLKHYLWPQPKRFFREAWRPSTWSRFADQVWDFVKQLRIPSLFWMGLRGALLTLVWLIPAFVIMGVTRDGDNAADGVIGVLALLLLSFVLLYLPMLQTNFAAQNNWRAMFQWRQIRKDFRYAPWSWAAAMLIGLVLMPIPLYLLKIEATPQEITWLPCLLFVAFMLPARIAEGLALRRCRRQRELAETGEWSPGVWGGRWWFFSRWTVRLVVMPAIVAAYVLVLSVSQYTSWDGVETWVRQHALLVPVPFVSV
ncbi:DUF4013 domain-containing protein [Rhodopirellula sp. JC740]|uniref:DUF4013 domain-containing protein n=1 Tax=Rhodopirellula halodulae TaxID=2894198 RepID=A0ABS8NB59_9BACT|nr:DUF4013 domain-containing protein [Rhodopirellula sp. JC740]MCC9640797.1 DUF4013 domain-containing protein [Rhodopirellula sp. JC740]